MFPGPLLVLLLTESEVEEWWGTPPPTLELVEL